MCRQSRARQSGSRDPLLRHDLGVVDRPYRSLQSGQDHLEALASGQGAHLLRAFFQERIRECNTALRHDELWTVGLFDDLAGVLTPEAAFDLMSPAVEIALEWRDGALYDLAITQLESIARASRTTEVPVALDDAWDELRSAVERYIAGEHLGTPDIERSWNSLSHRYRRV